MRKKGIEERAVVKSFTIDRTTLNRLAAHHIKNFSLYACEALNAKMDHDDALKRVARLRRKTNE